MGKAAYSCRRRREREVDSSHRSASLITNAQSEARPGPSEADYSIALRIFRLRARVIVAQSTNEAE